MVVILLLVPSSTSSTSPLTTTTVSISQPKYHVTNPISTTTQASRPSKYYCYGSQPLTHHQSTSLSNAAQNNAPKSKNNFNREYVNHVTRINICSQIEANGEEPEAIVKEGE